MSFFLGVLLVLYFLVLFRFQPQIVQGDSYPRRGVLLVY